MAWEIDKALYEIVYEARNLFPVGSITEDPATGSAAAVPRGRAIVRRRAASLK